MSLLFTIVSCNLWKVSLSSRSCNYSDRGSYKPTVACREIEIVEVNNKKSKGEGGWKRLRCRQTRSWVICLAGGRGSTTSSRKGKRWKSSTNSWMFTPSSTNCPVARSSSTSRPSTGKDFPFLSSPACLWFYQQIVRSKGRENFVARCHFEWRSLLHACEPILFPSKRVHFHGISLCVEKFE